MESESILLIRLAIGGDYETLRESHLEPLLREALRYVGSEESFDELAGCDRAQATSEEAKILQLFELCREALACWGPQPSRWTEKLIENRTSKILESLWTADGKSEQEKRFTAFDRAIDALENGQENPSACETRQNRASLFSGRSGFENIDMTGCLEAYFPGASVVTRGICDQLNDDEMVARIPVKIFRDKPFQEAVLVLLERSIAAANKQ